MTPVPGAVGQVLRGWARRHAAGCQVITPADTDEAVRALSACAGQGLSLVPRGHGCSYTGTALNAGNVVLDTRRLNRVTAFDVETGILTAEAGVSMAAILDLALPRGWMLGGVPGGPWITVGGAIGNNVHGKDSYLVGTFGRSVVALTVMAPDGGLHRLRRDGSAEQRQWFDFVIGGMGLVGVVLEADIQLRRVAGPVVAATTLVFRDLAEMVDLMERHKTSADMMLGWVDAFSPDGRGSLEVSTFSPVKPGDRTPPIMGRPERLFGLLPTGPTYPLLRSVISARVMALHNVYKFRSDSRRGSVHTDMGAHAFPLAFHVPDVAGLFPGGFVEAQILLPLARALEGHRAVLALCRSHGFESWLCSSKLFRGDDYPLSYSMEGISLCICLPGRLAKRGDFRAFYDRLVDLTAEAGGLINLTKDEFLTTPQAHRLYPGLKAFLDFKRRMDPETRFDSDFHRRLTRPA
ncbi:MAG: FAD-binding oxidoreductase [Phaeospirillum sp.]|nr:FAD-binding oxidoreductase [Phaeospirillum sp.]